MELSSEFQSTLLDAKQLAAYPHLKSLMFMVNEGFRVRHSHLFATHEEDRFTNVEELAESLDAVGRFCIITQSHGNQAPRIVACSLLKAYHEGDPVTTPPLKKGDGEDISTPNGMNGTSKLRESSGSEPDMTPTGQHAKRGDPDIDIRSVSDWELGVVVVRPDPQLSKIGLAVRCASLLEQDLMERLERAEEEDGNDAIAPAGQRQPLTFWVKAAEGVSVQYWQRRGFETVHVKTFPKGFWGAYRDFELAWMKKSIPRRVACSST